MPITVEHVTRYRYGSEASYSIQSLRLTPLSFEGQRVLDWGISGTPANELTVTSDGFGNVMHLMAINAPHTTLEIRARGTVEVENRNGVVSGLDEPVPLRVFLKRTALTEPTDGIRELVRAVESGDTVARLHRLMAVVRERVDYTRGVTEAETTAGEALAAGKGVCQDHAHIFISVARLANIPARYVTGYLLTDGATPEAAHHAWAEAFVDGLGWVGFDVANDICPTERYVRLACALDAHYAAPIRGARRGGETEALEVVVRVQQSNMQQ